MEAEYKVGTYIMRLDLSGYCFLTLKEERPGEVAYRFLNRGHSMGRIKSELKRFIPNINDIVLKLDEVELSKEQLDNTIKHLEADAKKLCAELQFTFSKSSSMIKCDGGRELLFLESRVLHFTEAEVEETQVITLIPFEDIIYAKNCTKTKRLELGIDKHYALPVLQLEIPEIKDFESLLKIFATRYQTLIPIINEEELKTKPKYSVRCESDSFDRLFVLSFKHFMLQIYFYSGQLLEDEIGMEDVVGFLTNYGDLQISITKRGNEGNETLYTFRSKEDMQGFVKEFAKGKVLCENAGSLVRLQKHRGKSVWFSSSSPEHVDFLNDVKKKSFVMKAVVVGIGSISYKYLLFINLLFD